MAKRGREGNIINHKKRLLNSTLGEKTPKRIKVYEYWHQMPISRSERSKIMADMYIKMINGKEIEVVTVDIK